MKKLIFLVVICFLILGAFWLYTEINTRNFIKELPQAPQSGERTEINKLSTDQKPDRVQVPTTLEVASTSKLSEQENPSVEKLQKPKPTFNWRNDDEYTHKHKQTDPFKDHITEQQAKERGVWIGDPETMDPDELYDAEYKQLLERFGDIPQVHAFMEYSKKFGNDITISEIIAGLEASQYLFPSSSTRKTVDYYRWMQTKDTDDIAKIITRMTFEDVEYLRSLGIEVITKPTDTHFRIVRISTK